MQTEIVPKLSVEYRCFSVAAFLCGAAGSADIRRKQCTHHNGSGNGGCYVGWVRLGIARAMKSRWRHDPSGTGDTRVASRKGCWSLLPMNPCFPLPGSFAHGERLGGRPADGAPCSRCWPGAAGDMDVASNANLSYRGSWRPVKVFVSLERDATPASAAGVATYTCPKPTTGVRRLRGEAPAERRLGAKGDERQQLVQLPAVLFGGGQVNIGGVATERQHAGQRPAVVAPVVGGADQLKLGKRHDGPRTGVGVAHRSSVEGTWTVHLAPWRMDEQRAYFRRAMFWWWCCVCVV